MEVLAGKKLVKRDGSVHEVDSALSGASVVGFYFSAHWCPPCRMFTPLLADFYLALKEDSEPFEIIFVSSDRSEAEMRSYMNESHGDWFAVPFSSPEAQAIKQKYQISGIPALVIVSKRGDLITKDGRSAVQMKGPGIINQWKSVFA